MTTKEILNIIKKCSTFDIDGNAKYVDVLEYDMLANRLKEAIDYTRCCERDGEQFCDYCTCKKDNTVTICKECMDENFVD